MTRREISRMAGAVDALRREGDNIEKYGIELSLARISQLIGRAALGKGANVDAWKKWMKATGCWPPELVDGMAENEARRGKGGA